MTEKKLIVSSLLSRKLDKVFPNRENDPQSKRAYDISCDIIKYITNKSLIYNGTDCDYHEFGSRLLQLRHSGRANKILQKLKEEGILLCMGSKSSKESYVTKKVMVEKTGDKKTKGICKKYRLNSIYSIIINTKINYNNLNNQIYPMLYSEPCEIRYTAPSKRYSSKKYTEKEKEMYRDFISTVDDLEIDYKKLRKKAFKKINKVNMASYKKNGQIKSNHIEVHFLTSGKKQWMSRTAAQRAADRKYESLIKDGNKYYVAGQEQFLEYKKRNMHVSYMDAIDRLEQGDLYAKRNETNGRLDTNFTNLPSFLMKEIMKDNNLVQIDLANSQFAILSHMMEKEGYDTEDFNKFKNSAYNGTLYNEAMELMNASRDETKTAFFESLFSKETTKSERKSKLLKIYPTVGEYIKKVKERGTYKDFSIGLQKEESTIFIDGLYPRLKEKLSTVLTKHDAFIVKKEQVELAMEIITDYFKAIDFKGKMIVE